MAEAIKVRMMHIPHYISVWAFRISLLSFVRFVLWSAPLSWDVTIQGMWIVGGDGYSSHLLSEISRIMDIIIPSGITLLMSS